MFNLFKSKTEKADQPNKPKIRIVQPKPGQSMEDFMAEMQAEYGGAAAKQGDMSDLFKMMGKDAVKVLKDSGVDVEELIASGVMNREDIPS